MGVSILINMLQTFLNENMWLQLLIIILMASHYFYGVYINYWRDELYKRKNEVRFKEMRW